MKRRIAIMLAIMMILFVLLNVRIASVSLGSGKIKANASHGTYSLTINSGRGTIYDTNMVPITNKNIKYVAAVAPQINAKEQLAALSGHVKDTDLLQKSFQKGLPFTIEVNTANIKAEGIEIFTIPIRYEETAVAPHITGYADSSGSGVSGIEKAFDETLSKYSETIKLTYPVDAKNRALGGTGVNIDNRGNYKGGVILTIDRDIQKAAQAGADKYLKTGSVVVMDVSNGDIVACVSEPEYSPLNVAAAVNAADSPLINRVFKSYNLGSAFKIAITCAALDAGIKKDYTYTCTGAIDVSGREFHCEHLAGHGKEDMALAFANSCNPYFIKLGLDTGAQKLLETAKVFGFGKPTVLAPGLSTDAGVLPTLGQLSSPASVANFSMGQGTLMVTLVQVACMVSAVANGGTLPTARLVKGIYNGEKQVTDYPNAVADRIITEDISKQVREFMIKTVEEGTGKPAKPTYGGAGGKTATAETGWVKDGKTINQAWFAGFYPANKPKYAIIVMCENGSAGGRDAGPVFKYIADSMAQYFGYPKVEQ